MFGAQIRALVTAAARLRRFWLGDRLDGGDEEEYLPHILVELDDLARLLSLRKCAEDPILWHLNAP